MGLEDWDLNDSDGGVSNLDGYMDVAGLRGL
jgi:hypothetical protein